MSVNGIPRDLQTSGLLGNDCVRLSENTKHLSNVPFCVVSLVGGVCVLVATIGSACLVGLGVMLLSLVVNLKISMLSKDAEVIPETHAGAPRL